MQRPIVVDLDGTLIQTDMLHESALRTLRNNPLQLLRIPLLLVQGKAVLKRLLAANSDIDASTLPYNQELLLWLKSERAQGRKLILSTASDAVLAHSISSHLGIFDEVIASDGVTNNSGQHKARILEQSLGHAGFDYAGNSAADLPVWERAGQAILVNTSESLQRRAAALSNVTKVIPQKARGFTTWRRALRVHQWLKNCLLFVPLMASHQVANSSHWIALLLAFVAFSLCASAVYICNDLLDLESDRSHPRKRERPFASGSLPIAWGVLLAPALLIVGLSIGSIVGPGFFAWLLLYFLLTCLYSLVLKPLLLIDCLTLALLYTLRIVAGTAAVGLGLSFWLLAFSAFLFFSLALVKRYAEMSARLSNGQQVVHGRGYHTDDAALIQTMGITSGYLSALVLALYLNSDVVVVLYRSPGVVWCCVPIILFWVSWIWMQAHRGNMHDDPLVFAVKDRTSLVTGILFAGLILVGAVGLPW